MCRVDTRMESTRKQWRHASCGLKMQRKNEDLFDPIYSTSLFEESLSHICRRISVGSVMSSYSHRICVGKCKNEIKKSVATQEFLQIYLKSRFLPKVYTLNSQEFQLLRDDDGVLLGVFWLDPCNISLSLTHIQSPAFHLQSHQSTQSTLPKLH